MAEKGGLQLLPNTHKRIDVKVPGENSSLYYGILIFVLVFGAFAGLALYARSLNQSLASLDQDLASIEAKRNKKNEENLLLFSKQESLLSNLLTNHIFWSKAFNIINGRLEPQAQVRSFAGTALDHNVAMEIIAPNYSTVAKQIASFLIDPAFEDVTLGGIKVQNNGRLVFSVKLRFSQPKFLLK